MVDPSLSSFAIAKRCVIGQIGLSTMPSNAFAIDLYGIIAILPVKKETSLNSPAAVKPQDGVRSGRPPRTKENVSKEIVLGSLREVAPRPLNVSELVERALKNYGTPLSSGAVGSALRRLTQEGFAEIAEPTYLNTRTVKQWRFVGDARVTPRSASPQPSGVRCITPLSTTEERCHTCVGRLVEELKWAIESQRMRPPPYRPGVVDWLDRSDALLRDARALALELTNRKIAAGGKK